MTIPKPQMPELGALQNDDSMLTRRFGKEVVNYYAGSRINRYSFLRGDTVFLHKAALSPSAQYIALSNLNPLIADKSELAYLGFDDVKPLIGAEPFHLSEDESIKQYDSTQSSALVVFLGMFQGSQPGEIASAEHGDIKGQPYFAIDATPRGSLAESAKEFLKIQEQKGHSIQENPRAMSLHAEAGKHHFHGCREDIDFLIVY